MVEKLRLRTIAYHLIGQPWLQRSLILRTLVWKFFFGNRSLPKIGSYQYFGQNEIDRFLSLMFEKKGFFVEIGSNDGLAFSNCKHLELYRGWNGLLVEPILDKLQESKLHRSKRNYFIHAACATPEFVRENKEVTLWYSNMMTTMAEVATEMPNPLRHAELGQQFLSPHEKIHKFTAPAKTLKEILRESNAPEIVDFLSLDIEGHDFEILKTFDWSYSFRYILVEAYNRTIFLELLEPIGYKLIYEDEADNLLFSLNTDTT